MGAGRMPMPMRVEIPYPRDLRAIVPPKISGEALAAVAENRPVAGGDSAAGCLHRGSRGAGVTRGVLDMGHSRVT